MNSEEDISKAAESLVSTLKRLHDELLRWMLFCKSKDDHYTMP